MSGPSMVEPVPKYLFRIYCSLWLVFEDKEFSNDEAAKIIGRGERYSNQALHYLKKSGWLITKGFNAVDRRKHINKLVNPMTIIKMIGEAGGKSIVLEPKRDKR
ncbi:hypothetical protein [Methanocella conradii]|nr:hypothetical protein [Methanocella conradii]